MEWPYLTKKELKRLAMTSLALITAGCLLVLACAWTAHTLVIRIATFTGAFLTITGMGVYFILLVLDSEMRGKKPLAMACCLLPIAFLIGLGLGTLIWTLR